MTKPIFRLLSEKERKARIISSGTRCERLVCPMCGKNQFIESTSKTLEDAQFANPEGIILQVVYGGGRGSGFFSHAPECLTFKQMRQNKKYAELLERIKEQCQAILEELE